MLLTLMFYYPLDQRAQITITSMIVIIENRKNVYSSMPGAHDSRSGRCDTYAGGHWVQGQRFDSMMLFVLIY